eukprot:scaffold625_cov324-Pavlova_lutheri.AAC.44
MHTQTIVMLKMTRASNGWPVDDTLQGRKGPKGRNPHQGPSRTALHKSRMTHPSTPFSLAAPSLSDESKEKGRRTVPRTPLQSMQALAKAS